MSDDPEYRIAKLELKPDDVIVMKFDKVLIREDHVRIRNYLERLIPNGVKAMILERGMDVSLMIASEIEQRSFSATITKTLGEEQ